MASFKGYKRQIKLEFDYNEVKDNLTGIIMSATQGVCPTDVDDISDALSLIEQQAAEIDALKAHVERLRLAMMAAICVMPSGEVKADLRDAYDDAPEQNLNAVKRGVLDDLIKYGCELRHQRWVTNPMNGIERPSLEEINKQGFGLSRSDIEEYKETKYPSDKE